MIDNLNEYRAGKYASDSEDGFRLSTDGAKAALRADFVPVRTTLLRVEVPTAGVPAGAFFRATVQ